MKQTVILLSIWLGGCASIVTQDHAQITLTSSESATKFYLDGNRKHSPIFSVNQRQDHSFTGKKQGCASTTVPFEKGATGWLFGNILFGGIIGLIIDLAADNAEVAKRTTYDVTPDCPISQRATPAIPKKRCAAHIPDCPTGKGGGQKRK